MLVYPSYNISNQGLIKAKPSSIQLHMVKPGQLDEHHDQNKTDPWQTYAVVIIKLVKADEVVYPVKVYCPPCTN